MEPIELSVGETVALLNQSFSAYPPLIVSGELANFKISRGKWLYFDLVDNEASISFFGTVYALPGPLENGMLLKVKAAPYLHPRYGFRLSVASIMPAGSGSIRRAADLLAAKLEKEGLFAIERKRTLPYPPKRIGLITAKSSAAAADFNKIVNARFGGLEIQLYDVPVQGDSAPAAIVRALDYFQAQPEPVDVIVLIRGGGSPEDLAAFSNEAVTRAVAGSRIPTLVAIGHETDVCLAELAADQRASTPSNAAELLVPDKNDILDRLKAVPQQLESLINKRIAAASADIDAAKSQLPALVELAIAKRRQQLVGAIQLLDALSPRRIVERGYAIVYHQGHASDGSDLAVNEEVRVELSKADFTATIASINPRKKSRA